MATNLTGSKLQISKQTGVPNSTVSRLLNTDKELIALRDKQRKSLVQKLQAVAMQSFEQALDIDPKSKSEAVMSGAIAVDKIAVIEGTNRAEVNIDNRNLTFNVNKDFKDILESEGSKR